jgi:hypothetical protein
MDAIGPVEEALKAWLREKEAAARPGFARKRPLLLLLLRRSRRRRSTQRRASRGRGRRRCAASAR